jgi:hypothetical protein
MGLSEACSNVLYDATWYPCDRSKIRHALTTNEPQRIVYPEVYKLHVPLYCVCAYSDEGAQMCFHYLGVQQDWRLLIPAKVVVQRVYICVAAGSPPLIFGPELDLQKLRKRSKLLIRRVCCRQKVESL